MKKIIFTFCLILFLLSSSSVLAAEIGETQVFNVEPLYDQDGREEINALLIKMSPQLYWYLDKTWWQGLGSEEQALASQAMDALTQEFESKIYPTLTFTFGSEQRPGIDRDTRITILVHPLLKTAGGYFDTADGYSRLQAPESNEREMVYLNGLFIADENAKTFLAHEFMHLITFSQKEKRWGVSEETWLNELRAEHASTFLGYDSNYAGSNLERRVMNFLDKPYDSLTEWKNQPADYGAINLFGQYLVDHYGIEILADSLKSPKTGIASLNWALEKRKFEQDFDQIFTDWTIAVLVGDCSLGDRYCYLSENLSQFKVAPLTNFLPRLDKSSLLATNSTCDWAGNWHRFIGGQGDLELEFSAQGETAFEAPYVVVDKQGKTTIDFLQFDQEQKATEFFADFGSDIASLTIIPQIKSKTSDFSEKEPKHSFSWKVSTGQSQKQEQDRLIQELLAQIETLQKQIAALQTKIAALLAQEQDIVFCQTIDSNLYLGQKNEQVKCLQRFLKAQGADIYPEGIVSGWFGPLTEKAVIRFQEKHKEDVLSPWGLTQGTGFVGSTTLSKINEIMLSQNLTLSF